MPFPSIPSLNSFARWLATVLTLAIALALPVTALAPRAHAGDSEQVRKAREHYRLGDEAFKAGRWAEAYEEWEAGYRLSGRPLFLLNMGHAERKRGDLHNARALYSRYLVMEPDSKLRAEVETVIKEIDATLAAEETAANPPAAPAAASPPAPPPVAPLPIAVPPPPPDSRGTVNLGTEARAAEEERPLYTRWWLWAGVGAVVAAGVLTAVLGHHGDSYTKNGSLGTIGMAP